MPPDFMSASSPMSDQFPSFSIIIPTYNRPNQLSNCLAAVAQLDYPRDHFEVIVVDDGTPQSLDPIVDKQRTQIDIRLLHQANSGPAQARNTGAAQAVGRFLAFLDDDCAPSTHWLRILADHFLAYPKVLVGGYTINAYPNNLYADASQMLNNYLFHFYQLDADHPQKFAASNNMALAAKSFRELGGFDTSFGTSAGEDRDFCSRWLGRGWKLHFLVGAKVRHYQALNARAFLRQHYGYGWGNYRYHKLRRGRDGRGNRLESWRFYAGLLARPWNASGWRRAAPLTILLLTSQAANGIGYFWAKFLDRLGGM